MIFLVFSKSAYVFENKGKTFLDNKGSQLQKVADGGFITKVPFFCYFITWNFGSIEEWKGEASAEEDYLYGKGKMRSDLWPKAPIL